MRAQFAKTMLSVGQQDPRLTVLVGVIGAFGLREFAAKCPGRFLNVGIREQAMASAAAGMALSGFVPVIHSITPFVVERCFEQIKDDFGYHGLGGNVVSVGAGMDYSALGCTHHSYSDIALMKSLPGSQVFYPGTPKEFDLLFRQAYAQPKTINYFRLGGRSHGASFDDAQIRIGRGVRIRIGTDITIAATGPLLTQALQAAELLSSRNISAEVLHFPTIKPFDAELLVHSVQKTRAVVAAEDHSVYGGFGDELRRAVTDAGVPCRFKALGVDQEFLREYGSFDHLANVAGISANHLAEEARRLKSL